MTVVCAVQPPDVSVRVLPRQGLKHGHNRSGTDPGADEQYGPRRLVKDERAPWCPDIKAVADGETGVQVAAGGTTWFELDSDPVVARPGWSGERVVAQHRLAAASSGWTRNVRYCPGRAAGTGAPVGSSRRIEMAESLSRVMAVTANSRKPAQAGGGLAAVRPALPLPGFLVEQSPERALPAWG